MNSVNIPSAHPASIDFSSDLLRNYGPAFPLGRFSPAIAEQYAALICCFWRAELSCGDLAPEMPLDIIDLCPSVGSADLLCRAIARRLRESQSCNFRYLPVLHQQEHWTASSTAVPRNPFERWPGASLSWNLNEPDVFPVWLGSGKPYSPISPVVILAHDSWSQAEQHLYAIHYGKLFRANANRLSAVDSDNSGDLWQGALDSEWDGALADVLMRYRMELNSSPMSYPAGALSIMRRLISVSAHPLLIITKASGQSDDLEIRLASFSTLIQEYRRTTRLPVNFQLIAQWVDGQAGASECISLGTHECLQICVFGSREPNDRIQRIARCIDPALLSGAEHLVSVSRALGPGAALETRMNLLQLSRYDPAVFLASDKELVATFTKQKDFDRKAWRSALQRVWENRGACPSDSHFYRRLATVAMHCGHWGFARQVLRTGLDEFGENATDLAHLAWCDIRTGQMLRGEELVHQALTLEQENQLARQVIARLSERSKSPDDHWHISIPHDRLPIVLEPLDESHLESYFYQYRDPQIAIMTGLPALSSIEETRKWFDSQKEEAGKVNFAVMHEDWGFVGFVNLAVSAHAAFFCFWIGVDFQGLGISSASGRLLCRYASSVGVPVMLTSAYKDNHRSVRALKRIGFAELSTRALPPDQDRIFFALIDDSAGDLDSHHELVNYYQRENLPMQFMQPDELVTSEVKHGKESS